MTNRKKAVFTVRPIWVTRGRRATVIGMLSSSLRMLQFRLGTDVLCRGTKQAGLSFAPARIRVGPNTCVSTAAAAAAAATALRTAGWSCSMFYFFILTLLRKLYGGGCCCTEPSET